jgi:hypothetical protein
VGGFAGLGAGLVIGSLLGGPSGPDFKTNLHVPFNAEVDVIITDSSSGQQQATVLAAWKQVNREGQAPEAREDVVNKLTAQIAALMP